MPRSAVDAGTLGSSRGSDVKTDGGTMARTRLRVVASVVAAAVAASALAGCSILFDRNPPAVVADAVNDELAQLRELDGVASAEARYSADMNDGGSLDLPAAWVASIDVRLRPAASASESLVPLEELAGELARAVARVSSTVTATGVLTVAADAHGPAATLTFGGDSLTFESPAQSATDLSLLRTVEGVTSVAVAHGRPVTVVHVASPTHWGEVAAGIRQLEGFGGGALGSVALAVTSSSGASLSRMSIDENSPTPHLIETLSELATRDGVHWVEYNTLLRAVGGPTPVFRASLMVGVATREGVERVAAELAALEDSTNLVAGQPRADFSVSYAAFDNDVVVGGYLGLAIGSSQPDDLPGTESNSEQIAAEGDLSVVTLDPAAAAARGESDRLAIEALLSDAGDAAGVQGAVAASIESCAAELGRQAQASVVIPIFEIADNAQEGFDAITAAWLAGGFSRTDRAMGRDFYSADDSQAAGARSLSIRGTAEGISISATGACIVSE